MQYQDAKYAGYYNVGPGDVDCFQTGALVDLFVSKWGEGMKWVNRYDGGPHEANFLEAGLLQVEDHLWLEAPLEPRYGD